MFGNHSVHGGLSQVTDRTVSFVTQFIKKVLYLETNPSTVACVWQRTAKEINLETEIYPSDYIVFGNHSGHGGVSLATDRTG